MSKTSFLWLAVVGVMMPAADAKNLVNYGKDGKANMQTCEGDCDGDMDCAGSLLCFQRSNRESVPGCANNADVPGSFDFCYDSADTTTMHAGSRVLGWWDDDATAPTPAPTPAPASGSAAASGSCTLESATQNKCHDTISNYRKKSGKSGAGGCPVASIFDVSGMCCLTVPGCPGFTTSADCGPPPNKAGSYFLAIVAFAIALGGAYYAFGQQAIDRLKEDVAFLKGAFVADAKSVVSDQVDGAKAKVQENIQNAKDQTKAAAKNAMSRIVPLAAAEQVDGEEEPDGTVVKTSGGAVGGCVDSVKSKIGTDASELKEGLEGMDDALKDKFLASGKNTAAWGLFKLGRFVIAEITILVSLLTPSSCVATLKSTCEEGLWCCGPLTMHYFKTFVAYLGIAVNLGIPIYYVTRMRIAKGRQKYFPGSMSNELFKIVTGQPMYRVLPNADIEGNAQGRVHFGTKYLLGICGYSLGIGVLLQVMTAGVAFFSSACQSDMQGAKDAMTAAFIAIAAKWPELAMYYILFCVYIAEGFYIHWTLWFPCCCGCKPFVSRAFDDADKDRCCRGILDTRESPPKPTSCCNTRWFETMLYTFYAWFYFAIDDLHKAFKWKKLGPLKYPYWPKFDAFKQEYVRWRLTKDIEDGNTNLRLHENPTADNMQR